MFTKLSVNELTQKKELLILIQKLAGDVDYLQRRNGQLAKKISELEEKYKKLGTNYNRLNKKHQELLKKIKE